MSKYFFLILIFLTATEINAQDDLRLWYKQAARNWNEALPIGNGRLGAMVFGGAKEELLQLNESSLWSGGPANTNPNPHAPALLAEVRKALEKEDYATAEELTKKMQGLFTESYEPLGDLRLKFILEGEPTEYYRDLNVASAIATTRFKVNDTWYVREVFATAADHVIAMRLTSSKPYALNFSVATSSPLYSVNTNISDHELSMHGKAPSHTDPSYLQTMQLPVVYNDPTGCRGMRFELRVKIKNTDGAVLKTDSGMDVKGATEVVLFLSAATSFNGFDKCPDKEGRDEIKIAEQYLAQAFDKSFDQLKKEHVNDYQNYFNRLSFSINGNPKKDMPTDQRLSDYAKGNDDVGLESLYFQFGRYLLISSSRSGGMPANLQGIWNHQLRPPWSSNYTTNINLEMNYWMVESCNLSELHLPLLDLIQKLSVTGAATARNFYKMKGWTVHHNTDLWATTNPVSGSPMWANWPLGGAWLSQHLWEHYAFTGNIDYLKTTAYPLMKDAAVFCLDWLIEDKNGYFVTAPSTSPENVFITDTGFKGSVSVASTMDMAIIRDLFSNVIKSSELLQQDEEFRKLLIETYSKLFPMQVGKKGNLQEWYKDWEDAEPNHRHISHLFGLFPGKEISPRKTPVFADAARKSLELRGDGGTGWSKGWKINTWARLLDGNHAYKLIREQLTLTGTEGTSYTNAGGTYPNMLDAHPPFQIDGNFGGVSGMTEMILQSHLDEIHLLPALPDAWSSGKVSGIKARGGFEVDISWGDHQLLEANIKSLAGSMCTIRLAQPFTVKGIGLSATSSTGNYVVIFPTKKGNTYTIQKSDQGITKDKNKK